MFSQLPAVGFVSYNGYQLPPVFKATGMARNVYDLANRTVKYVNYVIHLQWEVTGGDPPTFIEGAQTDASIEKLRKCLMEAGGPFYFQNQGFGNFSVNAGGVTDVAFGPTPLDFSWAPIGSNRACRVNWSIEAHVPECCQTTPVYAGRPMEWTFEISTAIDNHGMTTRTVTGTIEIPMTRQGHAIPDIADDYRERINAGTMPVPYGFKRQQTFNVSRDKRTLDFSITDTEIDSNNSYPVGIVDVDVHYSVNQLYTTVGGILGDLTRLIPGISALRGIPIPTNIYVATMSGSYKVLSGEPYTRAYDAFQALVSDRRANAARFGKIIRDMGLESAAGIPAGFNFDEGIYDRSVSFSQTWYMPMLFEKLMAASGIWTKVPSAFNNGGLWQSSMINAFGVRGIAGLRNNASDDVIVDLCQDGTPIMGGDTEARITTIVNREETDAENINAKASWLHHSISFVYKEKPNAIRHSFYDTVQNSISNVPPGNSSGVTGGFGFREPAKRIPDVIQQRGTSAIEVELNGSAIRVGYRIPPPVLTSVRGVPARYIDGQHACEIVDNIRTEGGNQPIFHAEWHQLYYLDQIPTLELGEPNSFLGGGGDTATATPVAIPFI